MYREPVKTEDPEPSASPSNGALKGTGEPMVIEAKTEPAAATADQVPAVDSSGDKN